MLMVGPELDNYSSVQQFLTGFAQDQCPFGVSYTVYIRANKICNTRKPFFRCPATPPPTKGYIRVSRAHQKLHQITQPVHTLTAVNFRVAHRRREERGRISRKIRKATP